MTTQIRPGLLVLSIVVLGCAAPRPEPVPEPPSTRATMAGIVGALRVALPLSLSEARFAAPENQEALRLALAQLRVEAGALGAHGEIRDASFAYLSRFLAVEAAEIDRRYRAGELEASRFLLGELGGTCVSCHARLPAGADSALGEQLFEAVDRSALAGGELLQLELATRQFDRALVEYERILRDPLVNPTQLDLGGFVAGYLRVCIRVKGDLERPRLALAQWQARSELPAELEHRVGTWANALGELQLDAAPGEELARAREVQAAGDAIRRFPHDRLPLVHDLVTSSLIFRGLARGSIAEDELAEAYLLLGLSELALPDTAGREAPEAYLAAAIHAAPGSDTAREAFERLEAETLTNYTGSGGAELPPDVSIWLDELRALSDAS